MTHVDLLGEPLPEPLPMNTRLTSFDQLIGHTIKAAFTETFAYFDTSLVLVTETGCWLTADAENGWLEEPASLVVGYDYQAPEAETLSHFVCPFDLLNAGCISSSEYQQLKALEDERNAKQREKTASRLRAELVRLETSK